MKRTIFSIMAVAAVLTGCKETNVDSNSEKGFFVLKSVVADGQMNDIDISTAATKATPAELADVNSFVVKIESNLEGGGTQTYSYSDILDKAIELPTGSYQITAGSPEGKTAAWDQPLFEGVQNFSVVAGATSPVNVKCSLKNAMVSVKCTDTFITELSTFNIKVSANDNDFLTWSKNESGNNLDKQGYFTATELYVQIDGERSLDGSTAALTQTIKNVHPKDHIILNLDARVTGEVQQITLTVDGSVNVRNENVTVGGFEEIPIPDPNPEPNPGPDPEPEPDENAPQLVWASNPDFAAQPLAETMDVTINIKAPGKISSFIVNVNSPALNSLLPDMVSPQNVLSDGSVDLDLIDDATAIENLSSLLPTGDQLKGKDNVEFKLSGLLPMLYSITSASPDTYDNTNHVFTLKLKDEAGRTLSKAATFYYKK